MGYKATAPTVYIVYWPATRVVKAGFSCNQRWRAFVIRGATVVDLVPCDDASDAFMLEDLVDSAFQKACRRRAFANAKEAETHLGNGGGGWLECWLVPPGMTPMGILSEADWEAA